MRFGVRLVVVRSGREALSPIYPCEMLRVNLSVVTTPGALFFFLSSFVPSGKNISHGKLVLVPVPGTFFGC